MLEFPISFPVEAALGHKVKKNQKLLRFFFHLRLFLFSWRGRRGVWGREGANSPLLPSLPCSKKKIEKKEETQAGTSATPAVNVGEDDNRKRGNSSDDEDEICTRDEFDICSQDDG